MISLQKIVDFAKTNEIDYGSDINNVIMAYKALLEAKGLEEPDNLSTDVQTENANIMAKKQVLLSWYRNYMRPSIVVGEDAAKIFYEHIDFFREENEITISPHITYIGGCDCIGITGRPFRAKVFIDTSDEKNKKEVFFNFYETNIGIALESYPGLILRREVMR